MMVMQMFLSEKIEPQHLESVKEESDYWERAAKFVQEHWNVEIEDMSNGQLKWLNRIHEDLTEMRVNRKSVFS